MFGSQKIACPPLAITLYAKSDQASACAFASASALSKASAAGSLEWLHERLAPDTSFDELIAEAAAWPPGAEGLLFAPYLAGERTPHACCFRCLAANMVERRKSVARGAQRSTRGACSPQAKELARAKLILIFHAARARR